MNAINVKKSIIYPIAASFILINGVKSCEATTFNLITTDENDAVFQKEADYEKPMGAYVISASHEPRLKGINYSLSTGDPSYTINDATVSVISKLNRIKNLGKNWNGYDAEPFKTEVISKAEKIVFGLSFAPEVFPTASGTIQFEYHKMDGSYLEFEISEDETIPVYEEAVDGEEREYELSGDINELNHVIEAFYGC